mmetsp:Transcript_5346/g.13661  ORF Transcript_5346/g.13661 Transcript_5346/m.13661 type:complete len:205 (-) Transcript_5346:432-1046(-)
MALTMSAGKRSTRSAPAPPPSAPSGSGGAPAGRWGLGLSASTRLRSTRSAGSSASRRAASPSSPSSATAASCSSNTCRTSAASRSSRSTSTSRSTASGSALCDMWYGMICATSSSRSPTSGALPVSSFSERSLYSALISPVMWRTYSWPQSPTGAPLPRSRKRRVSRPPSGPAVIPSTLSTSASGPATGLLAAASFSWVAFRPS